mmetsp:Transcript_32335/g.73923  ORF Transcript_32335/g.73923 Transcript_32335/m.73923 type:complete len:201 (-) Transcript_32335:612-1214(-)
MIGGPVVTKSANRSMTGSKDLGLSLTAHTKNFGRTCQTVSYGDFFTRSNAETTETRQSLPNSMSMAPLSVMPLIMFRMPAREPASCTSERAFTYAVALAIASDAEPVVGLGKIASNCLQISPKLLTLVRKSSSLGFGLTPRSASCKANNAAGAAIALDANGKRLAPIKIVAQNCIAAVSKLQRNWHLCANDLELVISPGM